MQWSTASTGATLGIDWSARRLEPIDPYLIWADLTAFASFQRDLPLRGAGPATALNLRVALEIDPARPDIGVPVAEVVRSADSLFATASISADQLETLLGAPGLKRLELSFVGGTPPADTSAFTGAPVGRPVVAVIDFGCAFAHERFRVRDAKGRWKTRIAYLWDQSPDAPLTGGWQSVAGHGYGRELRAEAIDGLISDHLPDGRVDEDAIYQAAAYNSVARTLTHGTHVLDLAAGGDLSDGRDELPEIIFVQLPDYAVRDTSGGSMVTHVMDALRYIRERTVAHVPIVVNLSYGSMAGPHDGSTVIESAMDAFVAEAMDKKREDGTPERYLSIVLPAGNNFEADAHAQLTLSAAQERQRLQWQVVADDDTDTFLEVWYPKDMAGAIEIAVTSPAGEPPRSVRVGEMAILAPAAGASPIAGVIHRQNVASGRYDAMVLIALAPTLASDVARAVAPSGVWSVDVRLTKPELAAKATVQVNAWIERDDRPIGSSAPLRQSKFLSDRPPLDINLDSPADAIVQRRMTSNSIGNGARTVVVAACLATEPFEFSRYSSAGPTRNSLRVRAVSPPWPDLAAPADESRSLPGILAAGTRSGIRVRMNGTSVAAPQVARELISCFLSTDGTSYQSPQAGLHARDVHGQVPPPPNPDRLGAGRLDPGR